MSSASHTSERSLFLMFGAGAGVCAFLLQGLLTNRPAVPTYEAPGYSQPQKALSEGAAHIAAPSVSETPKGGAGLYAVKCAGCHQATGAGLPGAFPPLAGSSWLAQDPETPIRIVLLGLTGPIEVSGQKFDSTMPPLGALSDAELAEILSYVRSAWGNQAAAITPEAVATVRASLAGRTTAWDAQSLSALREAK